MQQERARRGPRRRALGLAGIALVGVLSGCSGGGAGAVQVQISGEEIATDGLRFPTGSEVTIVDGWELRFDHVLVTVGQVRLSDAPDTDPADASRMGDDVATEEGPFAVDLAREGELPGAAGEGSAVGIAKIEGLPAGERLAFSYGVREASADAVVVNFADDPEAKALYAEMVSRKYTVAYAGTATFLGTTCETSNDMYDFTAIPTVVPFVLGFQTPVENLNCQNQDNQGDPFEGEEYQRGISIRDGETVTAQMTFHLDHPFYSGVEHEPALYFDQMAAALVGAPQDTVLTTEGLQGLDPRSFTDGAGAALPWRSCDGTALGGGAERFFDTGTVPVDPDGTPDKALRDYRDFVSYVQSTQGHLNGGEGLCFVKRNYPSPQ